MAQYETEHMRAPSPPFAIHDRRTLAEIDLRLLAGRAFHALEPVRMGLCQPAHEAFHRIVRTRKSRLRPQVLVNALGRQATGQLLLDERPVWLALAFPPPAAGGRNGWVWFTRPGWQNGWVCPRGLRRAGGRNGWFCRRQSHIPGHRLPVHAQFPSYPPLRPALLVQRHYRRFHSHIDVIHRRSMLPFPGSISDGSSLSQCGWFSSAHYWLVLTAR